MSYVIAHDVGTSSIKTAFISYEGEVLGQATSPYETFTPNPGWVEQNPEDYWNGAVVNTKQILHGNKLDPKLCGGIVFSTQAMGIILLDENGVLMGNNITWVDGRAEHEADKLMKLLGGKRVFTKIVGLEITGKDVIPKLKWLKKNQADRYERAETIFDVNGYLKFKATGKKVFEWSGACSYGFDLKKKDWERLIFKAAGVDLNKFPPLVRSTDVVGTLLPGVAKEMGLPASTPVFGGCDDTQSAAIGSGANGEGEAHIYLGTSAWAGIMTARNIKHKNGAAVLQSADPGKNILVGITESAGSNVDWMIEKFYKYEKDDPKIKDIFEFIDSEREGVAPGSDHLIFTPWLLGERCPVSTTTTRGTIFNLGLEHSRGHMINAMLEGVAYNLRWIFENFRRDFGFQVKQIRAIGGGSVNSRWMQGIADISGLKVETVSNPNISGTLGAASCAMVGSGVLQSFKDINQFIQAKDLFIPNEENKGIYDKLFASYKGVYKSLRKEYIKANLERFNTK